MDKMDNYKLVNSWDGMDDTDQKREYRRVLDAYNDLVEITQAFIRMTRAFPNY